MLSNLFSNNMQVTSAVSISYPTKLTPLEYISFVICVFAPPQDKSVGTPHQPTVLIKYSAFVKYLSNSYMNQSITSASQWFSWNIQHLLDNSVILYESVNIHLQMAFSSKWYSTANNLCPS